MPRSVASGPAAAPDPSPEPEGPRDVSEQLGTIVDRTGVPGLAAAVIDQTGVIAIGASGRRRIDEAATLQIDDRFHLGSDTKAMTAFLVGRLVDAGELRFDLSMAEVFAEHAEELHPDYRGVTIEQLLRHRGGLPANFDPALLAKVDQSRAERALRPELARVVLSQPPVHPPGSDFLYSNVGYIVVGAALEMLIDQEWETLMQTQVFDRLGMSSCGFGPVATPGEPEQPWAHFAQPDGTYQPTTIDNPAFLGPAGTVHCSLRDWGKFAAVHFVPDEAEADLSVRVSEDTRALLHTPVATEDRRGHGYAMGWLVDDYVHGDGVMISHDGSNTVNYASIVVVPQRKLAVLAACNAGDRRAQQAVVEAVLGLLSAYGKGPDAEASTPAPES